jgi:hypothetical protein
VGQSCNADGKAVRRSFCQWLALSAALELSILGYPDLIDLDPGYCMRMSATLIDDKCLRKHGK